MFNQFYGHIFEEVKKLVGSDDVTTNKLENIRDRIPGLWSAYRHYPLEGPMRAGVFHRWYQMILWQCDEKVVDQAIEIFTK